MDCGYYIREKNLFTMSENQLHQALSETSLGNTVDSAIALAERFHLGQLRHGGDNYIVHPYRVALRLCEWGYRNPDIIATALLHDSIEDCSVKVSEYGVGIGVIPYDGWKKHRVKNSFITLKEIFGDTVENSVRQLTNHGKNYRDYINGIDDDISLIVKCSDVVDNVNSISQCKDMSQERKDRLRNKYRWLVSVLLDKVDSPTKELRDSLNNLAFQIEHI